ncbi:MAG: hypothetical protein SF339_09955 [Blastocatellia bacterium]|nr:hypothetical protein [Blastocatellia bacterium]
MLVACVMGVVGSGLADTIRLRDGSVLKGKVVSYSQRKFTIVVSIGGTTSQHVVSVDEIDSVEFDGSEGGSRVESLGANPSGGGPVSPSRGGLPREAPVIAPPPAPEPGAPPSAANSQVGGDLDASMPTIAEKTVSVAAAADWTSTEIRVQRGQRIVISATGEVDLGDNQRTGPEGVQLADNGKLLGTQPTGLLIAVVGDDNNDFIPVGKGGEFRAPHNGILFLSVNEGNLKDNNGAFVARVKVFSGR